MYRVGILEAKHPRHGLTGACKIFHTTNNQVTVFTSRAIFDQTKRDLAGYIDEFEWIIKDEGEDHYVFLDRVEKVCNERMDLLIVNTIRITPFLFFNPRCKKLLKIYNTNFWLESTKSYFTLITNVKYLKNRSPLYNAITGPAIRRFILGKYDGLIVEYEPIRDHIKQTYRYGNNIYVFPNHPYEPIGGPRTTNPDRIRVIVPGKISERRRDYSMVIDIFEEVLRDHRGRVELFLLGSPAEGNDDRVLDRCRRLKDRGDRIFFFEDYVSDAVFSDIFASADFVISPLKLNFEFYGYDEVYSVTKGTGVTSDCIRYGKPFIVPKGFRIASELRSSVLVYEHKEELRDVVESLISDQSKLLGLKQEALDNSNAYSLGNLHPRVDRMVRELV